MQKYPCVIFWNRGLLPRNKNLDKYTRVLYNAPQENIHKTTATERSYIMKKCLSLLLPIFAVLSFITTAMADIEFATIATEAERDTIIADNTLVATALARPGGGLTYELLGTDHTGFQDTQDVPWVIGENYPFELEYSDMTGFLEARIIPPSSPTVFVFATPNTWFNEILIGLDNNSIFFDSLTLTGNSIDGESFNNLDASPNFSFDGVRITLNDNNAGNVPSFLLEGTFRFDTTFGAGESDFVLQADLIQNADLVPEPSTMSLFLFAGIALLTRRKA